MVLGAFKKLAILAAVAVATVSAATPNAPFINENGILEVGAVEAMNVTASAGSNQEHFITFPGASYISVNFANMDLPEGDVVVVRSPDGTDGYVYTGKGRGDLGTFTSSPVRGQTAVVEYFALNSGASASKTSYQIEGYVRGFSSALESVCGADQTRPAKCFQNSATIPQAYAKSQAVARLLIRGRNLCTGWLVGTDGHFMTNEHCITSAAAAAQIDIEFGAESASCSELCATALGCKGTIEATSATFVTNNVDIDYALLKLPQSLVSKYGSLQFRASGPVAGEKIYIPQHPSGWAKRVAATVDGGADATIRFVGRTGLCGPNQVEYLADTQGGSSGSPVLSQRDNLVVGLHHCGGCDNQAAHPDDVISDLRAKGINIPGLVA